MKNIYSNIKTSSFSILTILANNHNLKAYHSAKTVVDSVDEMVLSFSRTTESSMDCRYQHEQLKYLVRNRNSLAEIRWRILKFGDIYNYIDYTSQSHDMSFLPRIRNLQKILRKILNKESLVWTERDLFLEYTKFPRACFKSLSGEYKFVSVVVDEIPFTTETVSNIETHINLRIGSDE